jgi:hypothetical protein
MACLSRNCIDGEDGNLNQTETLMTTNQNNGNKSTTGTQGGTHEQHVAAGSQSHKNDATGSGNKQSGAVSKQSGADHGTSRQGKQDDDSGAGNKQSGAHATKQSDSKQSDSKQSSAKQSDNKQSDSKQSDSKQSTGTQGGTHEQHVAAGRQSHKNDDTSGSGNKQSASTGSKSGDSKTSR